jgi:hypothetical protein
LPPPPPPPRPPPAAARRPSAGVGAEVLGECLEPVVPAGADVGEPGGRLAYALGNDPVEDLAAVALGVQ